MAPASIGWLSAVTKQARLSFLRIRRSLVVIIPVGGESPVAVGVPWFVSPTSILLVSVGWLDASSGLEGPDS